MTGCQLWGGTLCGPVGTTREASNMVQSGFPVPPLHVHCAPLLMENAPELLALKESTPSCPVMLRISSRPQAPASRSWPSVQARKGRRPAEKPFNPMEFSKSRARFRAWVLGQEWEAGSWGRDEIRNIVGKVGLIDLNPNAPTSFSTAPFTTTTVSYGPDTGYNPGQGAICDMDISRSAPTGPQNVPQHIWQPIILYLGRPK